MTSMFQADNFSSLSVLHLSSPSHILSSSCSPDKDLLLVISRLGIKDTVSLWKMQGSKKWEVDVSVGNAAHEEVTGIAWSPDGMSSPQVRNTVVNTMRQECRSSSPTTLPGSVSIRFKMEDRSVLSRLLHPAKQP